MTEFFQGSLVTFLNLSRQIMKRKFRKDSELARLRRIEYKCDRILGRLADSRSEGTIDSLICRMHKAAGELERMARSDVRSPEP